MPDFNPVPYCCRHGELGLMYDNSLIRYSDIAFRRDLRLLCRALHTPLKEGGA